MPAARNFRQGLSGARDDGTLVGKGGGTQKLGAAATRRLASRTTDTAVSKPVERPPSDGGASTDSMNPNAGGVRVPAWKQLADKGIDGQGSRAANMAKLAGFQVGPAPPTDGTVMTDGGLPAGGPAAGVSGASPEILMRIQQLAAERGLPAGGPAPSPATEIPTAAPAPPVGAPPPGIEAALRNATGGGLRPPAIPGFQVPPGIASTLPATMEAAGAPGPTPPPALGGMTKPMLGARQPEPPGGTAGGAYDGLANVAAGMRRRNSMAGLEA